MVFPRPGGALREIVLINITGADRPGLTAAITSVLDQVGVNILDIVRQVIHYTLSLFVLVKILFTEQASYILKDVRFTEYKLDRQVRLTPDLRRGLLVLGLIPVVNAPNSEVVNP